MRFSGAVLLVGVHNVELLHLPRKGDHEALSGQKTSQISNSQEATLIQEQAYFFQFASKN